MHKRAATERRSADAVLPTGSVQELRGSRARSVSTIKNARRRAREIEDADSRAA